MPASTKTKTRTLTDDVRESPVDIYLSGARVRIGFVVILVVGILIIAL